MNLSISVVITILMIVSGGVSAQESILDSVDEAVRDIISRSQHGIVQVLAKKYPPGSEQSKSRLMPISRILGTGFAYGSPGYYLTTAAVVEQSNFIDVIFPDGSKENAILVGVDQPTRIALIKGTKRSVEPLKNRSEPLQHGSTVVSLAYGYNGITTVAHGYCSIPVHNQKEYPDIVTFCGMIYDGNLGGAILDSRGHLAGMLLGRLPKEHRIPGQTVETADSFQFDSGSNGEYGALGEVVTVRWLDWVFTQLKEKGRVDRGWLGITIDEVYGPDGSPQVLIKRTADEGPADKAGLRNGDIIRKYQGIQIRGAVDLIKRIQFTEPGSEVTLGIQRDTKNLELKIQLAHLDESQPVPVISSSLKFGIRVQQMTRELAKFFKSPLDEGVLVSDVDANSPAYRVGIRPGDVIVAIGDYPVTTVTELVDHIEASNETSITLKLNIAGRLLSVTLSGDESAQ